MTSFLVGRLFGSLSEFSGFGARTDDDMVDRVNHVMTTTLMLAFAVLVTTSQFVGTPIICVDDHHKYEASQMDYVNNLCWVKNTNYVPLDSRPKEFQSEVLYYQWVPIILLIMAACFKAPNLVWRMLNGATGLNIEKMATMAEATQLLDPDARDLCVKDIAHCLDRWLVHDRSYNSWSFRSVRREVGRVGLLLCCLGKRSGTFLCGLYVFTKLLYLANTVAQFYLLQVFLGFDLRQVVDIAFRNNSDLLHERSSALSYRLERFFPRQTLCHFKVRQQGNIQPYTFQCLLPANMMSEKIFIIVWLWLCLLTAVNAYSLLLWFYRIALRRDRVNTVAKYLRGAILKPADRTDYSEFLNYYLRDDGVFVLRLISDNSHSIVLLDLLPLLWKTYRDRIKAGLDRKKREEEKENADDKKDTNGCTKPRDSGETISRDFDLGEGIPMETMTSSFRYRKAPL